MSSDHKLDINTASQLVMVRSTARERWARWVSDLFCPPILAAVGILMVAHSLATPVAWRWAAFYLACTVLVPTLYILWLLNRGQVTDFHLGVREQRFKPNLAILAAVTIAWGTMLFGAAPRLLLALATIGILQMVLITLVTLRWKISGHAAGAGSFFVLGWMLWGAAVAPLAPLVPLVMWARVQLHRHSLLQTVAGAFLGSTLMLGAFYMAGRF
jgi:membrane-associated phospholipid phosphatase